jgi:hypothetical protein
MDRDDDGLEKTIGKLIYRMRAAGNTEQRLIMRELEGLLPYEMAQPIMGAAL